MYSPESTYLRKSEGGIEHFLFEIDNFELLNGKTKDERIQNHMSLTSERTYSSKVHCSGCLSPQSSLIKWNMNDSLPSAW